MSVCLVSVGTTKFDDLVNTVLGKDFKEALFKAGYSKLIVQGGSSVEGREHNDENENENKNENELQIKIVKYVSNIDLEIAKADLVIAHAGSGTVLAALRPVLDSGSSSETTKKLIVVPNQTLAGNHQLEIAESLRCNEYAVVLKDPSELVEVIQKPWPKVEQIPAYDSSKFVNLITNHLYSLS